MAKKKEEEEKKYRKSEKITSKANLYEGKLQGKLNDEQK